MLALILILGLAGAGLKPASTVGRMVAIRLLAHLYWVPAYAGMTVGTREWQRVPGIAVGLHGYRLGRRDTGRLVAITPCAPPAVASLPRPPRCAKGRFSPPPDPSRFRLSPE